MVKLRLGAGQPGRPALWPFLDLTVSTMTEIHYTHIGGRHGKKKNHLTLERSIYLLLCMQPAYKHAIITPSFEKRYARSHNLYELKVKPSLLSFPTMSEMTTTDIKNMVQHENNIKLHWRKEM